jgi:hypothetical protein
VSILLPELFSGEEMKSLLSMLTVSTIFFYGGKVFAHESVAVGLLHTVQHPGTFAAGVFALFAVLLIRRWYRQLTSG